MTSPATGQKDFLQLAATASNHNFTSREGAAGQQRRTQDGGTNKIRSETVGGRWVRGGRLGKIEMSPFCFSFLKAPNLGRHMNCFTLFARAPPKNKKNKSEQRFHLAWSLYLLYFAASLATIEFSLGGIFSPQERRLGRVSRDSGRLHG